MFDKLPNCRSINNQLQAVVSNHEQGGNVLKTLFSVKNISLTVQRRKFIFLSHGVLNNKF